MLDYYDKFEDMPTEQRLSVISSKTDNKLNRFQADQFSEKEILDYHKFT